MVLLDDLDSVPRCNALDYKTQNSKKELNILGNTCTCVLSESEMIGITLMSVC